MSLLVVGSIGIDTVETPAEKRENLLGGSAVYFSYAAAWYVRPRLLGVVGPDFPAEHRAFLEGLNVDLEGMTVVSDGKTFRWHGRYRDDFIGRETIEVQLNVLGTFDPVVPEAWRETEFVFLANGSPQVQLKTPAQMKQRPRFIAADTMDLWIETTPKELAELLQICDLLSLNDDEARQLTGKRELLRAGREIQKMGPKWVVVKKGEHGSMLIGPDEVFALPALPLERITDPTGAGDSFAGGMMGYLAQNCAGREITGDDLRTALLHGTAAASFTVEGFSLEGLRAADKAKRAGRLAELRELCRLP